MALLLCKLHLDETQINQTLLERSEFYRMVCAPEEDDQREKGRKVEHDLRVVRWHAVFAERARVPVASTRSWLFDQVLQNVVDGFGDQKANKVVDLVKDTAQK